VQQRQVGVEPLGEADRLLGVAAGPVDVGDREAVREHDHADERHDRAH
jgi:hypothetical protein